MTRQSTYALVKYSHCSNIESVLLSRNELRAIDTRIAQLTLRWEFDVEVEKDFPAICLTIVAQTRDG
jgi:hypothetical protein